MLKGIAHALIPNGCVGYLSLSYRRWALVQTFVSIVLCAQVELTADSYEKNLDGCVMMTDKVKPKFSKVPGGGPLHPDLRTLLDETDHEIRDNLGNPKWLKDVDPFNWPHLVPSTCLPKRASET